MPFAFEKLIVYQKAITFADTACSLTKDFPRGYFLLANQLNRAALSIAANIAEGNGRFTKPDRKNFFGIARGSAQECVPLLEIARRSGFVQEAATNKRFVRRARSRVDFQKRQRDLDFMVTEKV